MARIPEPSTRPRSHVRAPLAVPPHRVALTAVCPHGFCQGLLVRRSVVTVEGTVEEDACVNCGRAYNARPSTPYRRPRLVLSREAEARLEALMPVSRGRRGTEGEVDGSAGSVFSSSALDDADRGTGFDDESLPVTLLDWR